MASSPWWEPLRASVPSPGTRLQAIGLLRDLNGLTWEQAAAVDRGLTRCCASDEMLIRGAKRVCHNGVCDPSIFATIPLEELACQTDEALRCPSLARLEDAQLERERLISAMLREKYDNVNATAVHAALLSCRACKSSDVTWQQRQVRGADESMTLYCTCGSCGTRWKMT